MNQKWKVFVVWNEIDNRYVNMLFRDKDELGCKKRIGHYVAWDLVENRIVKSNEKILKDPEVQKIAFKVASEIKIARKAIKENEQ